VTGGSAYYEAVTAADARLQAALASLRDRQDAGEVTARQAADERIALLEGHLAECQRLRREHLGG